MIHASCSSTLPCMKVDRRFTQWIIGITLLALSACSAADDGSVVAAQSVVVSTAAPIITLTPTAASTPTPAISVQSTVELILAASKAQTHVRFTGTRSQDIKLFKFTAEHVAPDRFYFHMDQLEFMAVAGLFYVKAADQWVQAPEEKISEFQQTLDELFHITPEIVEAQLLGPMDLEGVATHVYEYTARLKSSTSNRIQQARMWVRQTDNLPIKRETSYQADGAQIFAVQSIEYDPTIVIMSPNEVVAARAKMAVLPWREFSSAEGNFVILLPETPQENVQWVNTPLGQIEFHMFMVTLANSVYMVAYGDYPAEKVAQSEPTELLTGAQAGAIANTKGTLVAEDAFTLDSESGVSYPGRAVRIALKDGRGLVRLRLILVGTRLYQVMAVGQSDIVASATTNQFLDSFRLLAE